MRKKDRLNFISKSPALFYTAFIDHYFFQYGSSDIPYYKFEAITLVPLEEKLIHFSMLSKKQVILL